ncbi:MAG: Ig-like domain-containing protein [Candidatus Riflebacteria bacterium]|nr:Ig-like domain-containing protein [Candidatus Riflebacteria bacterium]
MKLKSSRFINLASLVMIFAVIMLSGGCGGSGGDGGIGSVIPITPEIPLRTITGKITTAEDYLLFYSNNAPEKVSINSNVVEAAVANAEVWLENVPEIRAVTNATGNYILSDVPIGSWRVVSKFSRGENDVLKMISSPVTITEEKSVQEKVDLSLKPGKNLLIGRVMDTMGNFAPVGTRMSLWGESFLIEKNGLFQAPLMPEGYTEETITVYSSAKTEKKTFRGYFVSRIVPLFAEEIVKSRSDYRENKPPSVAVIAKKDGNIVSRVARGETIKITAAASDPDAADAGNLKYYWDTTRGTIASSTGDNEILWTAPAKSGMATISVVVADLVNATSGARLPLLIDIDMPEQIDRSAPTIATYSPANYARGIDLNATLTVVFSEPVYANGGEIRIKRLPSSTIAERFQANNTEKVLIDGHTVVITPGVRFEDITSYTVEIDGNCFSDEDKNYFEGLGYKQWTFSTTDKKPVTISLTSPYPDQTIVSPISFKAVFNKLVEGFEPDDITVTNGSIKKFSKISAQEWVFDVTPENFGNVDIVIATASVADFHGNVNDSIATITRLFKDSNIPSTLIDSTSPDPTNSTPLNVKITFNKEVTEIQLDKIIVNNGKADNLTKVSDVEWQFQVIPETTGLVEVMVPAGVARDSWGNGNSPSEKLVRVYDNIPPFVTLSSTVREKSNVSPILINMAFSENILEFELGDIVTENAIAANLVKLTDTNWTVQLTPLGVGTVTVSIPAGAFRDNAFNSNPSTAKFIRYYDNINPTTVLLSDIPDNTNVSPIPVKVLFSKDVYGFEQKDVVLTNTTMKTFQKNSDREWLFDLAPIAIGTLTIDISADVASDSSGNGNHAAVRMVKFFDNMAPQITFSSNIPNPTNFAPIAVKISFNEKVYGFEALDILTYNCSVSSFRALSEMEWLAELLPSDIGTLSIEIASAAVKDIAGNENKISEKFIRYYENVPPLATITSVVTDVTYLTPIPIKVVFSEDVNNFDTADVLLYNGTVSNFQKISNREWAMDIIPANIGSLTVQIASNSVKDYAGNTNPESSVLRRTFDNENPSVILSSDHPDNYVKEGDSVLITADFTELIGINESNPPKITVGNLVLNVPMTRISNLQWTYYWIVPTLPSASISISISARDLAGNHNTTATGRTSYIIDNQVPYTISLSPADDAIKVASDAMLVMNFSEPVELGDGGAVIIKEYATDNVFESISLPNPDKLILGSSTVTIRHDSPFQINTAYYVQISSGTIKDIAGNYFTGIFGKNVWNFTTVSNTSTILSFNLANPTIIGVIDDAAKSVTLKLTPGEWPRNITPIITHSGDYISPDSGVAHTFYPGVPETYIITAQDGSKHNWYVTAWESTAASPRNAWLDVVNKRIYNVSQLMEYSVNGGTSWTACGNSYVDNLNLVQGNIVYVRYKNDDSSKSFLGTLKNLTGPDYMTRSKLYVSSTEMEDDPYGSPGDLRKIRFSFANIGNQTATSTNIKFYISEDNRITETDSLLGEYNISSDLGAGVTRTDTLNFTVPLNITGGKYYIGMYIDNQRIIEEINEDNNYTIPENTIEFTVKETDSPKTGAFKIVNSWGVGSSWENVADGHYWITYKTAKKQQLLVNYYNNNFTQQYKPTVLAIFKASNAQRDKCKITIGLGSVGSPIITKEFQMRTDSVLLSGNQPFPDSNLALDISEFANYINDYNLFLQVENKSNANCAINNFSVEFYYDYDYPKFKTLTGLNMSVASGMTQNTTITTKNSLSQTEISRILPLPRGTSNYASFVQETPTQSELEKDMRSVGVFEPGKTYNSLALNRRGTGFQPPTASQWRKMSKLRQVSSTKFMGTMPDTVDHSTTKYFPPIGDQGSKGACTGFAMGYYIHTFMEAKEHNWDLSGTTWLSSLGQPSANLNKIFSPDFIYNQINSGQDNGSSGDAAATLLIRTGGASWREMPYSVTDFVTWPAESAWREASRYRGREVGNNTDDFVASGYFVVRSDADVQLLKSLINAGYCVMTAIKAGDTPNLFEVMNEYDIIDNDVFDPMLPDHAQTVVGYKEGTSWNPQSPEN